MTLPGNVDFGSGEREGAVCACVRVCVCVCLSLSHTHTHTHTHTLSLSLSHTNTHTPGVVDFGSGEGEGTALAAEDIHHPITRRRRTPEPAPNASCAQVTSPNSTGYEPTSGLAPSAPANHQQPEVNYLPRFSPQLISLERYTLSVYRAGEIDLFENLEIVHIRLLVEPGDWYLHHPVACRRRAPEPGEGVVY